MTVFYVCRRAVLTILTYVRCFEWEVEHYGGSTAIISLALVVSKFLCPPNSPVMDPHRTPVDTCGLCQVPDTISTRRVLYRFAHQVILELHGLRTMWVARANSSHFMSYKLRTQVASWLRWLDVYVRLRL